MAYFQPNRKKVKKVVGAAPGVSEQNRQAREAAAQSIIYVDSVIQDCELFLISNGVDFSREQIKELINLARRKL